MFPLIHSRLAISYIILNGLLRKEMPLHDLFMSLTFFKTNFNLINEIFVQKFCVIFKIDLNVKT